MDINNPTLNSELAPETQPISIDTNAPVAPSAQTADTRATKAEFGLGELLGKSKGEIYSSIMLGQEQQIRAEAAAKLDALQEQNRIKYLIDNVKANNLTLTIEQMEQLRKKPANPDSVFEEGYAKKYLESIYNVAARMPDSDFHEAVHAAPAVVQADLDRGVEYQGNYEYARKKYDDIKENYENQGWLPWIADQIKNIIPFYSAAKLRGWLKEQPALAGWIDQGSNLDDQTRILLSYPPEQFRAKLDEILGRLSNDNPTLALQYINAVLGMSTTDVALGNVNGAVDVAGFPGLTAGFKAALRGINTGRIAVKDAIKSANVARPVEGQVAEAFGDTGTAAVERAKQILKEDIAQIKTPAGNTAKMDTVNDPIRRAKESLPTNFILDKENIAANPGPLSRELVNRITQQYDFASKAIVDTIENTSKVMQIPLDEATDKMMNTIKEEVKNQHPGISNGILDVGDPVYNIFGNNYNFPVKIGRPTGELFPNEATARRFANENGILEYDIAGKAGARYYIPEAAVKRSWESAPRLGEVTVKNGELRILTDDGAEVQWSLKPQPGMIPIEVDNAGKITFHPTIKTEAEVGKAIIDQQGLGFYLTTWKPLDTTQAVLKDMTIGLDSTKSITSEGGVRSWLNSIIGYARSSDSTLSPFEIHQRKTATYSVSNYQKLMHNEMKYIEDLARGRVRVDPVTGEDIGVVKSYFSSLMPWNKWNARSQWKDFQRALANAKDEINPATKKPGYFWENPAQLNEWYLTNVGRPASFEEHQAYFAFVRNYENDRVFRSLREYTNKALRGAEQHSISYVDARTGAKVETGFFEGVQKKELPGGDWPVLVISGGKVDLQMSSKLGSRWKDLYPKVERGEMVVTELYNPEIRPLKDIPQAGHNYVRYVVSDNGARQSKPLGWDQVNRLSGGHFDYNYENAIKEAKVTRTQAGATTIDRYEGDKMFAFVANRKQGENLIKVLNEVKRLLRNKDENGAREVFENGIKGEQGPAMNWSDYLATTKETTGPNGVKIPAVTNINEPYYVVPKGKSIYDMDKSLENRYKFLKPNGKYDTTFQDGTRSGSLARQYQVGYTQERDAENVMALRDIGSKNNPIYKHEPAEFVDPITTMNRALNQITRSSFMDDMKMAGMETWLREAENHLKEDIDVIRSSPFYAFKNSDGLNAFKSGTPLETKLNLLSNRFKTEQFVGVPSKWDLMMHETSQKLSDWMYDTMGPKGLIVPTWLLTKTTSPVDILKSMAYHAKLGLFAIPQLLTQSQTYATIAAVSPRSAGAGSYGALLHQWSRFASNPAFIDTLDRYASKLNLPGLRGFKPGDFKEAMQALDRSGFANVGGEYGPLDTQFKHTYIKGDAKAALSAGEVFFKEAEKNVRLGAWYTAFVEYKAENKIVGKLSKEDWAKVLDKADDLSGNMSRASSSILQSGPLSLTGQFLTYQMHLAEFFWGKRIGQDVTDRSLARIRMGMMYGGLFGVGGLGVTGLPLAEDIRKAATDRGYVVGDNWLSSVVMEGLPAVFLAWATSPDGDIKKGNWYNIGDKLGAGGFTQLRDLMQSDAKWWAFLTGASGGIAYNTWDKSIGLRKDLMSMLTGQEGDKAFKATPQHWIDLFKEVTSVNQAWKGTVAVTSGKWLSKNETYQTDVTPMNAIFMSLTGLNLQEVADNYVISELVKDQKEQQKWALNKFTGEFRRAITAANNDDYPSYKTYMTNAFLYLEGMNYPLDKYNSAIAIASKNWEERIASIREEFYTKNVPAGKEEQRLDAYTRFLKIQDNK